MSSNTVLVKPKNEGLSFLVDDGQETFGAAGSNGEQIVIIADTAARAHKLAKNHYQDVDFELEGPLSERLSSS